MKEQKSKNKKLKSNNAITLIALIITIIVLLILAMVSIKLVWDGGIIKHAQNATNTYTVEQEKELIKLAYSDYKMKEYNPLDDLNALKGNFLGKVIDEIADPDKSTDERIVIIVNGEEIAITSEDLVTTEENTICNITYKGKNYKLILSSGDYVVTNIKGEGSLEVKGASVDENEENGWIITFNSGNHNRYELDKNGTLTSKWWKLSKKEKEELKDHVLLEIFYDIANNEETASVMSIGEDGGILIANVDKRIVFITDTSKNYYNPGTVDDKEIGKWYNCDENMNLMDEYIGKCPISMNDFSESEIYSKSCLERIINNFNT